MTKFDLAKHVAGAKNLSVACAEALVNQIFDCIEEALQRGERVEIRALGCFEIRQYGLYGGRNPRTGEAVMVKPKCLPFFKAGREIKRRLNLHVTRTQDLPAVQEDGRQQARGSVPSTP